MLRHVSRCCNGLTATISCLGRVREGISATSSRFASQDSVRSPHARLRFDSTKTLTFRQSLEVERQREARKQEERAELLRQHTQHLTAFSETVRKATGPLKRATPTTAQINIGKLCNLTCHHCHVESGPSKKRENMSRETVERLLELIRRTPSVTTVDITGGAPELNPHFRHVVAESRKLGKQVIDRCNLVVLFEKGQEDTPAFLAEHGVKVVASLPCYTEENTDKQRGRHVHLDSVEAIRLLNAQGYGLPGSGLELDLVYNPGGPFLPPPQEQLETQYRSVLLDEQGIRFNALLTLTNMPIKRFADDLLRQNKLTSYLETLANAFNPSTVDGLMCRSTVNIAWDGQIYDCDFNAAMGDHLSLANVWSIESFDELAEHKIRTDKHCYGCTAGSGSSCGGTLV